MRRAALAALVLAAAPAHAQQAGVYQGTTDDGQAISVTVAANPSSGNFEIVDASVGYVVTCVASHPAETRTWSPNVDITAPRQKVFFYNGYARIETSIVFGGASDAHGTVLTMQAFGFRFHNGGPRRSGLCRQPWKHYTLSYAGPASIPPSRRR